MRKITLTELKTAMNVLPQDIVDIIYNYKHGAEHYDIFKQVCNQIVYHYWMTRKIVLNSQFRHIFYPDFYSTLWLEPMTTTMEEGGGDEISDAPTT